MQIHLQLSSNKGKNKNREDFTSSNSFNLPYLKKLINKRILFPIKTPTAWARFEVYRAINNRIKKAHSGNLHRATKMRRDYHWKISIK